MRSLLDELDILFTTDQRWGKDELLVDGKLRTHEPEEDKARNQKRPRWRQHTRP